MARVSAGVLPGVLPAVLMALSLAAAAAAQTIETDPLQCWWRTSAGAVHQGEIFTIVLTCAAVETGTVKVVPDQAPLDPTVMQMPPFEVLGGTHPPDLRADDRRFFQYEYRARVISEELFGKDVKLPDTKLTFRVQTRGADGVAMEGREQTYFLPPLFVRVLSLVPEDATDIRDASRTTFNAVEARQFRANTLRTVGGVLFALSGLMALITLARLISRYRRPTASTDRLIGDATVLASVRHELLAIRQARQSAGWTLDLVGRLAAALRIAAGYALPRTTVHLAKASGPDGDDGHLFVRAGLTRGRTASVSSSATAYDLAQERARPSAPAAGAQRDEQTLKDLERGLRCVTEVRYGREGALDEAKLDDALDTGLGAARRLKTAHAWPARKMAAISRFGTEMGQRVWAR